jgi:uncharacterized protein (TIGR02996 family)
MTDSEPFLQEIIAAPDDDGPRLVYADWLEEQGDPRGEFIRLQCELAQSPVQPSRLDPLEKDFVHDGPAELRIREAELLREHERLWFGAVGERCSKWMFHRGFVAFVELPASSFVEHGSRLFAEHPIRAATIMGITGLADRVARCSHLASLNGLSIGPNRMDRDDLEQLLQSEHFPRLKRLILIRNQLTYNHAMQLARSPRFDQLQELDLTGNEIRNTGAAAIVHAPTLANLQSLHFNSNSIRLLGARATAESPYLQQLKYLDLRNNQIPRRGIDLVRARFGRSVCDT